MNVAHKRVPVVNQSDQHPIVHDLREQLVASIKETQGFPNVIELLHKDISKSRTCPTNRELDILGNGSRRDSKRVLRHAGGCSVLLGSHGLVVQLFEVVDGSNALGQSVERVDERNQLDLRDLEVLAQTVVVVQLKQDLESGSVPGDLHLAP
ncbi:hypothetical protein OGAPHI_003356 [Ogataea philodendri]|uniref:Uncharacterized protein n=1 Tax=Ogataea philodendri TaxID=1378263 RepID=A0A9P8T6F2_9ASCO|nr:uncharacterized protein OGAPHI_003356 [Ogataea philodendri]KAH3666906.1 hypothetical protein OGAPHI_003356 [Ogataea philodendri]